MASIDHFTEFELRKDRRFMRVEGNQLVRKRRKRRGILKIGVSIFLCLFTAGAAAFALKEGYLHLITSMEYDVRSITIIGCERSSPDELKDAISFIERRNIFTVNLETLKNRLKEGSRWVEDASIKKLLPSEIVIEIKERKPAALFLLHGTLYLTDRNAVPIDAMKPEYAEFDFPILTGIEARTEKESIKRIQRGIEMIEGIRQHRPSMIDMVSEINCAETDYVKVILTDGSPVIYLDSDTFAENIDHYLHIKEDIVRQFGTIEYIDLRWRDRVIVKPQSFVR